MILFNLIGTELGCSAVLKVAERNEDCGLNKIVEVLCKENYSMECCKYTTLQHSFQIWLSYKRPRISFWRKIAVLFNVLCHSPLMMLPLPREEG